jgi:hypothetical protein
MIVFASRAFNVPPLLPICRSMLNDGTVCLIKFYSFTSSCLVVFGRVQYIMCVAYVNT